MHGVCIPALCVGTFMKVGYQHRMRSWEQEVASGTAGCQQRWQRSTEPDRALDRTYWGAENEPAVIPGMSTLATIMFAALFTSAAVQLYRDGLDRDDRITAYGNSGIVAFFVFCMVASLF